VLQHIIRYRVIFLTKTHDRQHLVNIREGRKTTGRELRGRRTKANSQFRVPDVKSENSRPPPCHPHHLPASQSHLHLHSLGFPPAFFRSTSLLETRNRGEPASPFLGSYRCKGSRAPNSGAGPPLSQPSFTLGRRQGRCTSKSVYVCGASHSGPSPSRYARRGLWTDRICFRACASP